MAEIRRKRPAVVYSMFKLAGILKGIAADKIISESEVKALINWMDQHKECSSVAEFSETIDLIESILEDGVIDASEKTELLEYCQRFEYLGAGLYDDDYSPTEEANILNGFIFGIAADSKVNILEVEALNEKIKHRFSEWPYAEFYSLTSAIIEASPLDRIPLLNEIYALSSMFKERYLDRHFDDDTLSYFQRIDNGSPSMQPISTIFDQTCKVSIPGKTFCVTGVTRTAKRADIHIMILERKGIVKTSISRVIDFLVVGGETSHQWSFGLYGHKINQAMYLQKNGFDIKIIDEGHFMKELHAER